MGVHGLTTFLHENRRTLSNTSQYTLGSTPSIKTPVVVDGWSFIYKLYQDSHLPWVYGGEYPEFAALVTRTTQTWIDVGFEVYFVFDGPCPEIKFPTVALRLTQSQIQHSLLFFRTSQSSRNTARFLNETRILPPLAWSTCLQALTCMTQNSDNLQIHFADEEGDPFAVELAGRVGGYVIGNDSDFVVLNCEGYKGYMPLDEMVWHPQESIDSAPDEDLDGEFQTVRKTKGRKGTVGVRVGKGIIPLDSGAQILSVTTYSPELLAAHLKVPVTLLPLLGALVGNDFTSRSENPRRNVQSLFFERQLTLSQRIERAASTINKTLNPDPLKRRVKHHVGSVMDLINRTVNTLLARWTSMSSGEIEQIVEGIVNATLQYAIPKYQGTLIGLGSLWPTDICALHDPELCSLLPMISHLFDEESDLRETNENTKQKIELRGFYLSAYRKGLLSEKIMDILSTASYWPRLFLENPDVETVGRTIGRPIRLWMYSVLADAVGLPTKGADQEESITDVNEDDDEIVDVLEPDSEDEEGEADLLAPLKGELQRLHLPEQEGKGIEDSQSHASLSTPIVKYVNPKILKVTEHIRRGTRIAEETVDVIPLSNLLSSIEVPYFSPLDGRPLLLRPKADALTVLLRVLKSDTPEIKKLKADELTLALSLRWVIHTLDKRAEDRMSKEADKERWTLREARCFLATWSPERIISNDPVSIDQSLPVTNRNVQLTAQILMSLSSISELAGALLISDLVPPISKHFSGKKFHALLSGVIPLDEKAVPEPLWKACQDGLEYSFLIETKKKSEKKMKKAVASSPPPVLASKQKGSLFALLNEGTA